MCASRNTDKMLSWKDYSMKNEERTEGYNWKAQDMEEVFRWIDFDMIDKYFRLARFILKWYKFWKVKQNH